ncbi:hypothetical protein Pla100_13980 [Neorhodopirellula pilleata]|uniref:Uncharacterized protein n=1 Tax=Neorhodopirellula pilleata TaxID=2714738 RepID=A0A5C6ANP5_9BACT|nr:hypothetical protein Pla100_13980 [Neorhodopirellula pilleata]
MAVATSAEWRFTFLKAATPQTYKPDAQASGAKRDAQASGVAGIAKFGEDSLARASGLYQLPQKNTECGDN